MRCKPRTTRRCVPLRAREHRRCGEAWLLGRPVGPPFPYWQGEGVDVHGSDDEYWQPVEAMGQYFGTYDPAAKVYVKRDKEENWPIYAMRSSNGRLVRSTTCGTTQMYMPSMLPSLPPVSPPLPIAPHCSSHIPTAPHRSHNRQVRLTENDLRQLVRSYVGRA